MYREQGGCGLFSLPLRHPVIYSNGTYWRPGQVGGEGGEWWWSLLGKKFQKEERKALLRKQSFRERTWCTLNLTCGCSIVILSFSQSLPWRKFKKKKLWGTKTFLKGHLPTLPHRGGRSKKIGHYAQSRCYRLRLRLSLPQAPFQALTVIGALESQVTLTHLVLHKRSVSHKHNHTSTLETQDTTTQSQTPPHSYT